MDGATYLLAAVAIVGFVLAALLWRLARERAAALAEAAENWAGRLREMADVAATGDASFLAWPRAGDPWSGGMAAILGEDVTEPSSLDDLADVLADDDFATLRDRVEALAREAAAFQCELAAADGERVFEARGVPGPMDGAIGHILWLRDISAAASQRDQAAARATRAEDETARLARLFESLPVPVYQRDRDLRMTWCNAAYAGLVGSEVDTLVADGGVEIETPLIPGQGRAMAAAAAEIGELKCESRHFVVGGQRRALEVNELPGLPDGGVLGFVRDVTHVEESQDELERHIEAHAEVLNNLSTAIAIFGPDKRMSYHNSAYAKLWQLDEDWLSGRPLHGEILDELRENRRIPEQTDFPAYKQEFIRLYTDLLATQEDVIYPPDGRVLRQVISPHPFGGLLFLTEDITDSLVLERSYNTLIAVQRETLDNLYEGVAVYGGDGRLRLFNSAFATIWQLDERLLETEPHVSEIIDSARDLFAEHETWNELRELLISQATGRDTLSGRMERPDERIIDFAGVALPDGNMLFTYIDVTDSANVERALLERYEALETADRLKSEFLANVSYELRTPLNVIIGFAEVLANEYFGTLNDRQKEYTGDILNSSHQLLDLINAILDLASIEAGQLELEPAVFDVRTMLENVISLGRERAQKQQLHLSIDCPVDFGTIEGDERRLKQVLYNLLSNSLKYSDRRGEITVGVSDEGDEVGLYVADNGIGIAEADQQLVFEKFRRGSLTERQHSVGLGLSLVKSFIELHGGRVVMDSQVGEGTRVTCHLPRQQPAVPTQLSAPLTEFGDVPVAVLPSSDTRL